MPAEPTTTRACCPHKRPLAVRVMVWFVVWWMARLPVAVPDFHEVDHHHDAGQTCLYHEHLSRWHAPEEETSEPDHQALLHWHWLIPGWSARDYQRDGTGQEPETGQNAATNMAMLVPEHERFDVLESFIQENARSEKPLLGPTSTSDSVKENIRKATTPVINLAGPGLIHGAGHALDVPCISIGTRHVCHTSHSALMPLRC